METGDERRVQALEDEVKNLRRFVDDLVKALEASKDVSTVARSLRRLPMRKVR